jgi:hypothetical protein
MQATMDQMSVWMLISHASVLVKVVMLILVLSSVVSWYLIVRHGMLLRYPTFLQGCYGLCNQLIIGILIGTHIKL